MHTGIVQCIRPLSIAILKLFVRHKGMEAWQRTKFRGDRGRLRRCSGVIGAALEAER